MSYSQTPLRDLLAAGSIPGQDQAPVHIETVMSDVYLFDDLVYKLYKNDNEFFNAKFRDLSGHTQRHDFTRKDYEWNRALSPSIYLDLIGVSVLDGCVRLCDSTEAPDELVFVMKRVPQEHLLFERLVSGAFSAAEARTLGTQLATTLASARTGRFVGHNYFETFKGNIADIHNFIKDVTEYVSPAEAQSYIDHIERYRLQNQTLFEDVLSHELDRGGDTHSHNAVIVDGQLHLMDTYPPKDEWLIEHHLLPMYRIGTDLWGLSGDRAVFEAFVAGYESAAGLQVDRTLDTAFIIYAALITVSYHYMLQRTDSSKRAAAHKLHQFLRTYFAEHARNVEKVAQRGRRVAY